MNCLDVALPSIEIDSNLTFELGSDFTLIKFLSDSFAKNFDSSTDLGFCLAIAVARNSFCYVKIKLLMTAITSSSLNKFVVYLFGKITLFSENTENW